MKRITYFCIANTCSSNQNKSFYRKCISINLRFIIKSLFARLPLMSYQTLLTKLILILAAHACCSVGSFKYLQYFDFYTQFLIS